MLKERWKPRIGGKYYVLKSGHILKGVHKRVWEKSDVDMSYWNNDNCYKSKKEADFIYNSFKGNY